MRTVKIHLRQGTKLKLTEDNFPFEERSPVEFINAFSEEGDIEFPTLKDLSTIAYSMMGHGVTWQLAYELSKRLSSDVCNNPYELSMILGEIFKEYFDITEEEAQRRFDEHPKLHSPSCPTPIAYE